ncbi:MAG: alkaline serine exoprotease precursor [Actinomycetia bacterium]|nr:alkaline serine exoprotease precursor [Actinomycetes bacterium]
MTQTLGIRRGWTAVLAGTALAATVLAGGPALATPHAGGAVRHAPAAPRAVKDSYVVGLKASTNGRAFGLADVRARTTDLGTRYHGRIGHRFEHAVHGFEATMSAADAKRLAHDPAVAYVAPNSIVSLAADPAYRTDAWGLDRIDDHAVPGNYSYVPASSGAGVHAYVLDTGVLFGHQDFGGRATSGPDIVSNDADSTDCHGHGTHVAGTIAGTKYGVAKEAQIVGLRVVDCTGSGTAAQLIAGLDWVAANAVKPAVVNLSLRYDANDGVDAGVQALVAAGITVAVAAGNDNADACTASPARVPDVLTVGATDRDDHRASFSDYGTCVDLFAPGVDIVSDWIDSPFSPANTGTKYDSGTSMASPHVAGAAAMVLADHPDYTPAQVHDELVAGALTGKVIGPGPGSPDKLLFIGSAPRDFEINGGCGSSPVRGGSTGLGGFTFERKSAISQWVHLSPSGLPGGVSVAFDRADVSPFWQSPVWMTVTAADWAEPGYYTWTLTAAGSEDTHTLTCSLTVRPPQFTISASSPALTVAAGQPVSTVLSAKVTDGPASLVTFATGEDLPPGTTVTFDPPFASSDGGSTTMTVTPPATLPPGTYRFRVFGNGPWALGYGAAAITLTVTSRTDGCHAANQAGSAFPVTGDPGSAVTISGCGRKGLRNASVEVHLKHPQQHYVGLRLVGPDGTSYPLKEEFTGPYTADLDALYPLDLSAKKADGVWKLVGTAVAYTGTITSWTLTV